MKGRVVRLAPLTAGFIRYGLAACRHSVSEFRFDLRALGVQSAMPLDPAVKSELEELVKEAQGHSGIVVGMGKVMRKLADLGLMRYQQIEPSYIACHKLNRDGFGLSPQGVHQLLDDIVQVGWDSKETNPICVDVDPSDSTILDFNVKLASSSGGLLPSLTKGQCKYASLSASHVNAALRSIISGLAHDKDSPLCVDGHLSLAQVLKKDPAMHQACVGGLSWRVISAEAMEIDGLADLIQAGANTTAQLARGESEFQMVRRILNTINAHGGTGNNLLYETVKARIMKSKPACANSIPEIFKFLVRFGSSGHLQQRIMRTEERIKRCGIEPKTLGMNFYQNLSLDPRDPKQDACVHFRHAVVAMAYCTVDDVISSNDVKKISTKDPRVFANIQQGQILIKKMQKAFQTGIPAGKLDDPGVKVGCLEALDKFEDSVVMLSLEKKTVVEKIEEAACALVDKVEELTSVKICPDYETFRKTAVPTQAVQASQGSAILWYVIQVLF